MHYINACCLLLFVVVSVSIPVTKVMFHYNEDWANHQMGRCQRIAHWSYDAVCRHGYRDVPCRINQFRYALRNGTELTPYQLNLTLDSITESHSTCAGQDHCSCYFDQRNITGTLIVDSTYQTTITASLVGISCCVIIGFGLLMDGLMELRRR
jgi:hypothetical protein